MCLRWAGVLQPRRDAWTALHPGKAELHAQAVHCWCWVRHRQWLQSGGYPAPSQWGHFARIACVWRVLCFANLWDVEDLRGGGGFYGLHSRSSGGDRFQLCIGLEDAPRPCDDQLQAQPRLCQGALLSSRHPAAHATDTDTDGCAFPTIAAHSSWARPRTGITEAHRAPSAIWYAVVAAAAAAAAARLHTRRCAVSHGPSQLLRCTLSPIHAQH